MVRAMRNEGPLTGVAGEALAPYRRVKLSAGTLIYADAGEDAIGITTADEVASGSLASYWPMNAAGVLPVTGSKAITAGSSIYGANDGKVSDAAVGTKLGTLLEALSGDGGMAGALLNVYAADTLQGARAVAEYMEEWVTGCTEDGQKLSTSANKGDWLVTIVDGDNDGGHVNNVEDDAPGGILKVLTNDKASDSNELQLNGESFKLAVGKQLFFEASIAIDDVDKADIFVGLAITDTTVLTACTDLVGFAVDHDANVDAEVRQNSTASKTDTTVDAEDATLATFGTKKIKLAFHWDGVDTVRFFVNGVLKVTKTDNGATVLIPDDEALTPTICVKTSAAQVVTLWVDYIYVAQER
jgi:hypothetical protein